MSAAWKDFFVLVGAVIVGVMLHNLIAPSIASMTKLSL